MKVTGQLVDILNRSIYPAEISIDSEGKIESISRLASAPDRFLLPGFIDAHVHVESSMLVPSEFARMAVVHGTVATVSDPHEIANVLGIEGVKYMIANGKQTPFKFYFGAPSCVPATTFETAGASIDANGIRTLLEMDDVRYLAEMMNWPGVLFGDKEVAEKIAIAKSLNKVIDGHAPGLKGEDARKYIAAGMSTDHECFTKEEALDKLNLGMKVIIREGSAAKNFEALYPLLHEHYTNMMFCSDDKHPDSLEDGHINLLVKRAIESGVDLFKTLQVACINPISHYGLNVGKLRIGDPADFIVAEDLKAFKVLQTYINGKLVAENGKTLIKRSSNSIINNFSCAPKLPKDFAIKSTGNKIKVIEVIDDQIVTHQSTHVTTNENGFAISDIKSDVLKIVVVKRYREAEPAVAFVKNFGLKEGAIASSVAHDSHNIIAVGVNDAAIAQAVNLVIKSNGGVSAVSNNDSRLIPLPVAGIMSPDDGYNVAKAYKEIDQMAKKMGSRLNAPFMTLSFMALLVIPELKLSDKGLFDGQKFQFTDLFLNE